MVEASIGLISRDGRKFFKIRLILRDKRKLIPKIFYHNYLKIFTAVAPGNLSHVCETTAYQWTDKNVCQENLKLKNILKSKKRGVELKWARGGEEFSGPARAKHDVS